MQRSEHRILTTHAGSLPRPAALTRLYRPARARRGDRSGRDRARRPRRGARDRAEAGRDRPRRDRRRRAVARILRALHAPPPDRSRRRGHARDACRSRRLSAVQARIPGARRLARPGVEPCAAAEGDRRRCATRIASAIEAECADFRAALAPVQGRHVEAFLTAPSPGIIASIVQNEHYDSFERYLDALGAALQVEYEAIVAAGFLLQLDCPDLALERHTSYRDRPLADFVGFVEAVVAAINKALRNIPPDKVRLHVCWGNYEGPHDRDVALRDIWPAIRQAKAGAFFLPFANPRHAHEFKLFGDMPLERRSVADRGRDRHADQLRRAPGSRRRPHRAHRRGGRQGARARRDRLRLRHLGRHGPRRRGRRVGEAARVARWRAACVEEIIWIVGQRRAPPT